MTKTWLITASSRGFGWELAKAVLDSGDRVVATARRPEPLESLKRQYGDRVGMVALGVTDPPRRARPSSWRSMRSDVSTSW